MTMFQHPVEKRVREIIEKKLAVAKKKHDDRIAKAEADHYNEVQHVLKSMRATHDGELTGILQDAVKEVIG